MKKLLMTASFVVIPFVSTAALAGDCQHGNYAEKHADSEELLIAQEADEDLLELLRKQREQQALESEAVTYN